jgi:hypothetical protein
MTPQQFNARVQELYERLQAGQQPTEAELREERRAKAFRSIASRCGHFYSP